MATMNFTEDPQFDTAKRELFESDIIPTVTNAISSVLSRSKQVGLYEKAIELISDDSNIPAIDPDSEMPTEMLLGIPISAESKRKTRLNELLEPKLKQVIFGKIGHKRPPIRPPIRINARDDDAVKKIGRKRPPIRINAPYNTESTSSLPAPWKQHLDRKWNRYYYYNAETGVSTWDRPGGSSSSTASSIASSSKTPASSSATSNPNYNNN